MDGSGSLVVLCFVAAFAPMLALRMHRRRMAGGAAAAPRWRFAAMLSSAALVSGLLVLAARVAA